MINCDAINVVIIDDEEAAIQSLVKRLTFYSDIHVVGRASTCEEAMDIVLEERPDVLFLDIEMPEKTGFELLHEIRKLVNKQLDIIFYTGYEKYTIQALREAAFDFVLKPVNADELENCITRIRRKIQDKTKIEFNNSSDVFHTLSLPTVTGLKFVRNSEVVLFRYEREKGWSKGYWNVLLYNQGKVRLRAGLNASLLLEALGNKKFIQISQSVIVNLTYLSSIEIKSRQCKLLPPFSSQHLCISKGCMAAIRRRYDIF